ncbi:peptidoglycan/xylan/chitin deacetylase (PgdA/CDA1 family) [Salinibacter ruber]|uniref:polysaccharide deacetylase family protein n=1 Tax=Salinibacter ruber TaxID=146919 RepID=UPI0021689042|nr:polysaccharide deacetylase family protein [Salinibacter ruber]MCS3826459.1 peptidoglycan/xylan/chitin deacetylase (PgdA/CDA1 family) [Salinibacter ruber]
MIEVALGHSVSDGDASSRIGPLAEYSISTNQLKEFLESRKNNLVYHSGMSSLSKEIVLTFDDGYYDNMERALPLIEHFKVQTFIFVTTGFVEGDIYPYELELASVIEDHGGIHTPFHSRPVVVRSDKDENRLYQRLRLPLKTATYKDRERFMNKLAAINGYERKSYQNKSFLSWKGVAELDQHPFITIGAHTDSHPVLTHQWPWIAYREMKHSKSKIEEVIDRPVRHFSYPYGRNNALVRTLARWAGFRWAFTTERRRVDSIEECGAFSIPRIDIHHLV